MSDRLTALLEGIGPRETRVVLCVEQRLLAGADLLETAASADEDVRPTITPLVELARRLVAVLENPHHPAGPMLWKQLNAIGNSTESGVLFAKHLLLEVVPRDLEQWVTGLPPAEPGFDPHGYARTVCEWLLDEVEDAARWCKLEKVRRLFEEAGRALAPADLAARIDTGTTAFEHPDDTSVRWTWADKPFAGPVSRMWLNDDNDRRWPPPPNDDCPRDLRELDDRG